MKSLLLCVACFFLAVTATYAETRYVTDAFDIMVRSGPDIRHKIISMPKSGTPVEIIEVLEEEGAEKWSSRRKKNHSGNRAIVALGERTATDEPLAVPLGELEPVRLEVVTKASEVGLWNEYVERFHPLGYKGAFGYRLRYFICSDSQRLGCVLLAGAAKAIAVRDRWIGWNQRTRLRNLPRVINNSRFLIFPHVRIPHLASHVLGQLARRVTADWQSQWGFDPLLLETFVDPSRYAGTCYRAAGWELLGQTSGRGLARPGKHYRSTPRLVLIKPLQEDCRRLLCAEPFPGRPVR